MKEIGKKRTFVLHQTNGCFTSNERSFNFICPFVFYVNKRMYGLDGFAFFDLAHRFDAIFSYFCGKKSKLLYDEKQNRYMAGESAAPAQADYPEGNTEGLGGI